MVEIHGRKSRDIYMYDKTNGVVTDKEGNSIRVYSDLSKLSDNNKSLFIDELFHKLYVIQNDCKDICNATIRDGIEWTREM